MSNMPNNDIFRSLLLITLLFLIHSFSLHAAQRYQAPVADSSWHVHSSPIQCELIHDIDHYGQGRFVYSSGGELAFQLHSREAARRNSVASLYSFAPFWREPEEKELAQLTISKGNMPFYIGGDLAYRMLYELLAGRHPTFHYKDWAGFEDDVYVSVSSVRFHQYYDDFTICISNALDYGSDQVKDTALYFDTDKSSLSKQEKDKLREIALFARIDKDMKIQLKGHADGRGRRIYNKKLSSRRNASVEKYLVSKGVSETQISQLALGESRPLASNRSSRGRMNNRRVDVFIKHDSD
ncbi:MAG: OmpA family protein [Gammaproteobacteria bacterium]|nr:OmpA family protein [Gammaproteobacteria bacterium]